MTAASSNSQTPTGADPRSRAAVERGQVGGPLDAHPATGHGRESDRSRSAALIGSPLRGAMWIGASADRGDDVDLDALRAEALTSTVDRAGRAIEYAA